MTTVYSCQLSKVQFNIQITNMTTEAYNSWNAVNIAIKMNNRKCFDNLYTNVSLTVGSSISGDGSDEKSYIEV